MLVNLRTPCRLGAQRSPSGSESHDEIDGTEMNGTIFDSLREQVRGQVITPGDADYDAARAVHNGMIDKRPAAVVRVSQVADVIASVNFARDNSLDLAVRGGGHSGPGFGTWDDALVIDFANTTGVRVDPANRTARSEAGATWADFNHATHAFGLATTGGHRRLDRRRGADPRRRHRLPGQEIRAQLRQPHLGRRRHRGREIRDRERNRE